MTEKDCVYSKTSSTYNRNGIHFCEIEINADASQMFWKLIQLLKMVKTIYIRLINYIYPTLINAFDLRKGNCNLHMLCILHTDLTFVKTEKLRDVRVIKRKLNFTIITGIHIFPLIKDT